MKKPAIISLNQISKKYALRHEKPTFAERLFQKKSDDFYALKNISLTIRKGEKVGILGKNGSGKTTLLKILSGITIPTSGSLSLEGSVVSLIGLEAGFHPDLTGRENIYINGMILGMSRKEISDRMDEIIRYADIGVFIDEPLYTYSLGMKLRLSFSVAIYAKPDIFLLDEQLQVGDQDFKDKIKTETNLLFSKDKTIIMASHNLYTFFDYCKRILILSKGEIIYDGGLEAIKVYYKNFTYDYIPPEVIEKLEKKKNSRYAPSK